MKVFMGTDLEGAAGVVTFSDQTGRDTPYYEQARRLQTAEVNAAIEGFLEAGVEDVLVSDGHGPGAVVFEELHPAAKLIHGRPEAPQEVLAEAVRAYDVCVMLCQHAMAGTLDGNLNHTQSSRTVDRYTLNGQPIGEIAQFALYHGALGLPMILLTGDEAACREAEALIPGITTCAVKKGLSRNSALSLSAGEARKRIRAAAAKAVSKHAEEPLTPLAWPGPFVLEKRYFHTDTADGAARAADVERVDAQTVRIRGDSILDVIYR